VITVINVLKLMIN